MISIISKKMWFKKGFTLIELLVVIAIIGILSSIVIASLTRTRSSATKAAGQVFDGNLYQSYGADAVALWNFDEGSGLSAVDTSGNRNTITMANDSSVVWAASSQAYKGKSAFTVNGGSVTIPASTTPLQTFNVSNGSVTFWIKIVKATGNGVFCSSTGTGVIYAFCILDAGATGKFMALDWDGGATDPSGAPREIGTNIDPNTVVGVWTQVAFSWSIPKGQTTGTIMEYINGKQVASSSSYGGSTFVSADFQQPDTFCVGGDCYGDNMTATLDELHVYSQSLQTGEIEKLYAEESSKYLVANAQSAY